MDMSIWMWSLHASASMISTPLYSHSFRIICPISCLIFPQVICRRYLGANTIWYLYSHCVCAKLFVSNFIQTWFLLWFFEAVGRPPLFYQRRIFFLPIAKAFWNHQPDWWFSLTKKKAAELLLLPESVWTCKEIKMFLRRNHSVETGAYFTP